MGFNFLDIMTNKTGQKKSRPFQNRSKPRRRRRSYRNTGEKPSIEKRYFHLLEQYLSARRKYFDFFHRVEGRKLVKLKNNFYRTLEDLRRLEKEYNRGNKREDLTYSQNHDLDPDSAKEVSKEEKIEDFYLLQSQKEADCKEDMEESAGTMEDYLSYRGSVQN